MVDSPADCGWNPRCCCSRRWKSVPFSRFCGCGWLARTSRRRRASISCHQLPPCQPAAAIVDAIALVLDSWCIIVTIQRHHHPRPCSTASTDDASYASAVSCIAKAIAATSAINSRSRVHRHHHLCLRTE
ncbi:hypothetical protein BCR44DRAFT_1426186 [Catenaria anguillulae PL171]|uniref:Uncharacterized protein n=1 Tax=Catenaria anguillulae PL171 TaxID=765915 RepID=A0A1Y2HZP6_9FUNG|nr:hypothetical protein BCR44DRAFT_1426186 [Catenaria anguillulae PL171]